MLKSLSNKTTDDDDGFHIIYQGFFFCINENIYNELPFTCFVRNVSTDRVHVC